MSWNISDPVQVRANSSQAWVGGVVTEVFPDCYKVTLNTPMTSDAWTGTTRPYAGDSLLTYVAVLRHCETLAPDEHIRTPV